MGIRKSLHLGTRAGIICLLWCAPFSYEAGLLGGASAQKIELEDGVRVVHNTRAGLGGSDPKVSIEFVRTIGDVDTDDKNLAFNPPLDMTVAETGLVYILDGGNQRIQVFGPDGGFVRTIGQ